MKLSDHCETVMQIPNLNSKEHKGKPYCLGPSFKWSNYSSPHFQEAFDSKKVKSEIL